MFFECVLSSTVLMLPGTLFQLMGPWYANARCPYEFVLAAAMMRIFGSNDERSGLAGPLLLLLLLLLLLIIIIITQMRNH